MNLENALLICQEVFLIAFTKTLVRESRTFFPVIGGLCTALMCVTWERSCKQDIGANECLHHDIVLRREYWHFAILKMCFFF